MQFDDAFFKAVGLGDSSDEQKAKLIDQLSEIVQNRVAADLEEILTEEQLDGFDAAAEKGDEAAFEYLNQVYPDYPVLVQEEVEKLKAEMSHDVSDIMKAMESDESSGTPSA